MTLVTAEQALMLQACDATEAVVIGAGAPQQLLATNLTQFLEQLPLLRDGDERAIHDARVALRRLREPLALVRAHRDEPHLHALAARVDKVFKALGRARDADIAQRLVQHVESRFAMVPAATGHLRADLAHDQLAARRRLIKTLESTSARAFGEAFDVAGHRQWWRFFTPSPWRDRLRAHVQNRGRQLLTALDRAGGVYFPNRSHHARVAIKQFRYALELADALGADRVVVDARSLRRAQNALGEAHDREILIARLASLGGDDPVPKQEATLFEHFLAAEIREHHQKFVTLRPEMISLCSAVLRSSRRLPVRAGAGAGAVAIAALALGTAMRRRHG